MNKIEKKLYTATVTTQGERNGHSVSSDGNLELDLRMPKELGGPGGNGTNPEQLFAAGYSACFGGALDVAARKRRLKLEGAKVTANVTIGKDVEGAFTLAVDMDVHIPGVDAEVAKSLAEEAHQICPYSRATRGNIEVNLQVV